jgi:hypothetical protein
MVVIHPLANLVVRFDHLAGHSHPRPICFHPPSAYSCLSHNCLQYDPREPITVWLSKVGPYHNPQEVYSYYALPFCRPETPLIPETRLGGLGEILEGSELQNSDIPIGFGGT